VSSSFQHIVSTFSFVAWRNLPHASPHAFFWNMGCKQGKTSSPEATGKGFPTASQQASLSPQQKTLLASTMDAEKGTPSPNSQEDVTIEKFMVKAELGEEAQNIEPLVGPANYEPLVSVDLEAAEQAQRQAQAEQSAQQEQIRNVAPAPDLAAAAAASSFFGDSYGIRPPAAASPAIGMRPPAAASLAVDRAYQPDALQTAALNPLPSALEARAAVSAVRAALPGDAGARLPDARQSDEDDATGRRLGVKLLAVSQSPGASLAVVAQKDAQQPSQSKNSSREKKEGSGAGRKERQICCC